MEVSSLAGKPADPASRVNVPKLVTAYYAEPVEGKRVQGFEGLDVGDQLRVTLKLLTFSKGLLISRKQTKQLWRIDNGQAKSRI